MMNEKNKERAIEMFKLRLAGYTFREIGEKYGVSDRRVQIILNPKGRRPLDPECIYPNLKNWMQKNRMTVSDFAKLSGLSTTIIYNTFKGKTKPSMRTISKVLETTNMDFKTAFERN